MIVAVRIEETADVDRRLRLAEMRVGDRAVGVKVDERRGQAIEAALLERHAEVRQTNRLALRIHQMLVRVEEQAPAILPVDMQQQLDPIDAVARVLVGATRIEEMNIGLAEQVIDGAVRRTVIHHEEPMHPQRPVMCQRKRQALDLVSDQQECADLDRIVWNCPAIEPSKVRTGSTWKSVESLATGSGCPQPDGGMVQSHVRVQGIEGCWLIRHAPEHRPTVLTVATQYLRHPHHVEAGLGELQPEVIVFPSCCFHPAIAADLLPGGASDECHRVDVVSRLQGDRIPDVRAHHAFVLAEDLEDRVNHVGVVRPSRLQAGRQAPWIQVVVGIEHEHVGCRRGREALVARRRESLVPGVAQQKRSPEPLVAGLQPIQDAPLTAVRRVVIHDDQVEIREVLGDDAVECFENDVLVVIQRDHDRHPRGRVADRLEENSGAWRRYVKHVEGNPCCAGTPAR